MGHNTQMADDIRRRQLALQSVLDRAIKHRLAGAILEPANQHEVAWCEVEP